MRKTLLALVAALVAVLLQLPGQAAGVALPPLPPIPQPTIGPTITLPALPPLPQHHLKRADKATARFTKATDTSIFGASPRGKVTFTQHALNGPITAKGKLRGLQAHVRYLTVPYIDGVCAPLPGLTAFPSKPFTANARGQATFAEPVNPRAVNPAGAFNVRQTHSVSIRRVAATVAGTNVPLVVTEACNTHPRRHH